MRTASPSARPSGGFTLVEILITMTILGLVSAGALRFTMHALNIFHYDAGRIKVNRDIRSFTQQMTTNAVYSSYFRIFPSFSQRSVTSGGVTTDAAVSDGQSGDFLLLVFADTDITSGKTLISRIIGYYRDPENPSVATSTGPVRKFDRTLSPAVDAAVTPLYQILNTNVPVATAHTNPVVLQLAQGLSNGSLFYDFYDRSIMVRGQVIEQGNVLRRAVNTYNFTVSPRG
ncbi:prepilin-type N-terminal cleavage/methylation domain-containing protein [Horticoccus luteus]|uniref:Prepilin-type N-terminal cleavage/methylation domain-containing protein n=1 Tax=Horticoccus luteus TaxID=2862869 RepID=A0A8F9XLT7_9BACT|nr:prepilin-type N-terminal cleavage/methylation domain-containing protein [Horticoccus luteus]QYM79556.1 prepilin-type N-terminal cleavage/methylation domain-containing protein [Horticoccus luteus]